MLGPAKLGHDAPVRTLLPDLTPLRTNPAYRRLWVGFALAGIGSQMATVAMNALLAPVKCKNQLKVPPPQRPSFCY